MDVSETTFNEGDDAANSRNIMPVVSQSQTATNPAPVVTNPPHDAAALPLLRRGEWDEDKRYDKNLGECIHYDFRWKISLRENVRARSIVTDSALDVVLAPSDYFEVKLRKYLDGILKDRERFPGDDYECEKKSITISIERTRGRGLAESFDSRPVDWTMVDDHLEGLGTLFRKGEKMTKKITFLLELVYKESTRELSATRGQKRKRRMDDEARKAEMAKDASLWKRVYNYWRCRAKHCDKGPHCWPDERGIHHRLDYPRLADIKDHIIENMQEGEQVEDVDIGLEIPSHILKEVLQASRKRKDDGSAESRGCKSHCGHTCATPTTSGESSTQITGDVAQRLEEYCNWTVARTKSNRWRQELEKATRIALGQYLELNSVFEHPKPILDLMVKGGVKSGVALQFVSKPNIKQWWKEQLEKESVCT